MADQIEGKIEGQLCEIAIDGDFEEGVPSIVPSASISQHALPSAPPKAVVKKKAVKKPSEVKPNARVGISPVAPPAGVPPPIAPPAQPDDSKKDTIASVTRFTTVYMIVLISYSVTIGPLCSWMMRRSSVAVFWTSFGGNIIGALFIIIAGLLLAFCIFFTVKACSETFAVAVEENRKENREGIIL